MRSPHQSDAAISVILIFRAGEHHHQAVVQVPTALAQLAAASVEFQHALIDIWQHQSNWLGSVPSTLEETTSNWSPSTRAKEGGITNVLFQIGASGWLPLS